MCQSEKVGMYRGGVRGVSAHRKALRLKALIHEVERIFHQPGIATVVVGYRACDYAVKEMEKENL